jgi:hypothetical protein
LAYNDTQKAGLYSFVVGSEDEDEDEDEDKLLLPCIQIFLDGESIETLSWNRTGTKLLATSAGYMK